MEWLAGWLAGAGWQKQQQNDATRSRRTKTTRTGSTKLATRLVYYLLTCFLPFKLIHLIGKGAGTVAYYMLTKYRKRALSNLSLAENLDLKDLKKVAKASFQNLAIPVGNDGAAVVIDAIFGTGLSRPLSNLENLSQILKNQGFEVSEAQLRWIPSNTVEVTDPDLARTLLKLMDALEDLEDVQNVTANFEMSDQLMSLSMI